MPRLFTAVEVPSSVALSLSLLRGGLPGARWIDQENYHLTLLFIGDVDERTAGEFATLLARIDRPAFDLELEGVGAFGSRRPHALYAGVKPAPMLIDLQAEQERLAERLGLEPERRKYTPHVTVARLRNTSQTDVAAFLATHGNFRTAPFHVARFVLMSSRASKGGGPYLVEEAYPLAG